MNQHKITSLPRTSNDKSRIGTPKAYNSESLTSKRNNYGLYKISKAESPPSQSKKKEKKERKKEREVIFFGSHVPPNYPTHSHHTFHSTLSPFFGRLTHFPSFLFFILSHTLLSTLISSLTGTSTPPPPPLPPSFSNKITGKFLRTHKHCHILSKVKISNLFGGFYTFA